MENKNKKSFTITITEDDTFLYNYINETIEINDDEETQTVKKSLENCIRELKNIMGDSDFDKSFPSPEKLKNMLKSKNKDELVSIKEFLVNRILDFSSLFNQNITLNGISFCDRDHQSWYLSDKNPVAHIVLYSNYIDVINSLLEEKPITDNNIDSLLAAIRVPEKKRENVTKLGLRIFIKGFLTDVEAKIIIARYGLGEETPRSLLDLSKELNMTREKIRQITNKAILKLRAHVLFDEAERAIYSI